MPDLHVGVAVGLNLLCIVLFFRFVQQLATGLRPGSLVLLIGDRARAVIEQVYPTAFDPARPGVIGGQRLLDIAAKVVELHPEIARTAFEVGIGIGRIDTKLAGRAGHQLSQPPGTRG